MYLICCIGLGGSFKNNCNYFVKHFASEKEADDFIIEATYDYFENYSHYFEDEISALANEEYMESYDNAYDEVVENWSASHYMPYNEENVKKVYYKNYTNEYHERLKSEGLLTKFELENEKV